MKRLALLLAAGVALAASALAPLAAHSHPATDSTPPPAASPEALFSRGALRRARLLIQMRMLQLREERLACLRAVLLRRLPPDLVPPGEGEPPTGRNPDVLKHSPPQRATSSRSAPGESEECTWISARPRRPGAAA